MVKQKRSVIILKFESTKQALDALKQLQETLAAYNHVMGVTYLDASTTAPKGSYEGRGKAMVKRICIFILLAVILSGCTLQVRIERWFEKFSFEEHLNYYTEAGVKTEGFINTAPIVIDDYNDAIECAKNEVTISYDTIAYAFDEDAEIWFVHFGTEGMLGGDQSVYLDSKGITQLIVYGQ